VTCGRMGALGLKDPVSEELVAGIDNSEEVAGWGSSGMIS
jgi:hypothetical protein